MFETAIGLLASTGLRLREALALDHADVDLKTACSTSAPCKNHRQREVLLHPSATAALSTTRGCEIERFPSPATPAFFVTARGGRPHKTVFWQTFRELIKQAGLEGCGQRVRPRPHDLRHTFAVRTLIGWYRAGERHRPQDAGAVDLSRSRLAGIDLLVSAVGPRAARPGQ